LRTGDAAGASRIADEVVALTVAHEGRLEHPQLAFWMAARIRRCLGDGKSATDLLRDAHRALREKAAQIEDDGARLNYLRLSLHREIVAAFDNDEWPSADVYASPEGRPVASEVPA
jgi:hypothetical protein